MPDDHATLIGALEARLPSLVDEAIASFGLAGVAIGVVRAGAPILARGFGARSLATGEPVTSATLFHMASISKPFVATAVVQLAERGLLALDTPVVAYLPYFALNDPRSAAITVRQLLSHTAGVPNPQEYNWHAPEDDAGALERFVRGLAALEPVGAPGERFAYSNAGFEVLGDLIAKVSGQSFEDYLKANILDPLGMRNSTFLHAEVLPELAASPHLGAPLRVIAAAYPYNRAHAPSSTLHASVDELALWVMANLNQGSLGGARILRPASHALLWQPRATIDAEGWEQAVGLSWFLGSYKGRRAINHSGSDPGFTTDIAILPDEDAAVIVLANANTAAVTALLEATLDLLLGEEPRAPRPPLAVPVAAAFAAAGPEAAAAEYTRLLATERYDARPARFQDAVWGAIELRQVDAVLPFLLLWASLQPEAAEAHEMLGWAHMLQGRPEQAIASLEQALALNPESELAPAWLQQLRGA